MDPGKRLAELVVAAFIERVEVAADSSREEDGILNLVSLNVLTCQINNLPGE